jgi:peptidoglycan-associated lipoprotein
MKALRISVIIALAGFLSFGAICGGGQKPTLTPPKPAEPQEPEPTMEQPEREPVEPYKAPPEPLVFENIYFEFNKYDLSSQSRRVLRHISEKMQERPEVKLRIEGHCDERGTEQYNLALGEKRAMEAKKFLTSSGIDGDRISTISYGEERPADPRHNEEAWAKNRRDEFKVLE